MKITKEGRDLDAQCRDEGPKNTYWALGLI